MREKFETETDDEDPEVRIGEPQVEENDEHQRPVRHRILAEGLHGVM